MCMKKAVIILMLLFAGISMNAQDKSKQKFSPEKFRADMERFITEDACLTPNEAAKFFPLYDEMNKKQRVIFDRMRKLGKNKPSDEAECRNTIRQRDKLDLELKKIQQTYHEKFMTVISASKLFDVIRAEEKFHRRMLKKSNSTPAKGHKPDKK